MEGGDPDKKTQAMSQICYESFRELRAMREQDPRETAIAFERSGFLLRFDELKELKEWCEVTLAIERTGTTGFGAYVGKKVTDPTDDWSTRHDKPRQLLRKATRLVRKGQFMGGRK